MQAQPIRTRRFLRDESLEAFLLEQLPSLQEGSIIVIASKLIALAQGRWIDHSFTKEDIQEASDWSVETPYAHLTLVAGHWCPNAGMDASNAEGGTVLWPTDIEAFTRSLHARLKERYGLSEFGLLVSDSRVFPLRQGVTAVSLAHAGFRALRDYRGEPDLDGRPMRMTTVNVADALATAGAFLMGEGNERQPLCLIQDAPVIFTQETLTESLFIDPKDDLFAPLYHSLPGFPSV